MIYQTDTIIILQQLNFQIIKLHGKKNTIKRFSTVKITFKIPGNILGNIDYRNISYYA